MPKIHRLGLGRRRDPDDRDRKFLLASQLPSKVSLPESKTWAINPRHLDQGPTSTCVGHGWRNFLRCAPARTGEKVPPNAWDIYRKAVLLDAFPENDAESKLPDGDPGMESGTTVRAGAKAVAAMKELTSYLWAFSLQPTLEWLLTKGPVVIGTNWYESMFEPDERGLVAIAPGSKVAGGHCWLLRGGSQKKGLALGTTSWGDGFGKKGDFYLSYKDLERLILEDGEVCTAVQAPLSQAVSPKSRVTGKAA